jgi:hypothetical protein
MRTWILARRTVPCGNCRAHIARGSPLMELQIGDTRRARCPACAKVMFDEEPPADMPTDPDVLNIRERLNRFLQNGPDVRLRQSGERE